MSKKKKQALNTRDITILDIQAVKSVIIKWEGKIIRFNQQGLQIEKEIQSIRYYMPLLEQNLIELEDGDLKTETQKRHSALTLRLVALQDRLDKTFGRDRSALEQRLKFKKEQLRALENSLEIMDAVKQKTVVDGRK